MNFQIESLDPAQAHEKYPLLAELWNRALPPERAISAASVRFNLLPSIGVRRLLLLATTAEEGAVGFAIASALQGEPKVTPRGQGWLEALAVLPEQQGQGVGSTLLHHAESWLAAQHCAAAAVGGGPRPFCPGLPDRDALPPFWAHRAYQARGTVWDLAANLATYTPPPRLREPPCAVRPATPPQQEDLLHFLRREFPGRWRYEAENLLADGGRISDYMLLWTERGVDGCCLLTFPDSGRPLERLSPFQLPRPWGQLGSIGVSADQRGRGMGAALLDAGLRRLHNNGINGCVIDSATEVEFYRPFGFEAARTSLLLERSL